MGSQMAPGRIGRRNTLASFRPLEEIEADMKKIEKEIADMLAEATE